MSISLKLYRNYYNSCIRGLNFKERYPEIFPKGKDRIYVPIDLSKYVPPESSIQILVEDELGELGYEVTDYIKGTCIKRDKTDTRVFKIGRVLEMAKKDAAKDKIVRLVLTSHRINLVDKIYNPWISGKCIDPSGNSQGIKCWLEESYFKELEEKLSLSAWNSKTPEERGFSYEITDRAPSRRHQEFDKLIKNFSEDKIRNIKNANDYVVCYSRHPYDIIGMSTNRGWHSCMRHSGSDIITNIKSDIRYGTIIAYLIRKNDKNINNPVARINIKPYTKPELQDGSTVRDLSNTENTLLIPVQRIYGEKIQLFLDEVNKFIYKSQKRKLSSSPRFMVSSTNIYLDTSHSSYYSANSLTKLSTNLTPNIIFHAHNSEAHHKLQEILFKHKIIWADTDMYGIKTKSFERGYASIFYDTRYNTIQSNSMKYRNDILDSNNPVISTENISLPRINYIIGLFAQKKDPRIKMSEISNPDKVKENIQNSIIPFLRNPLPLTA